jgi:arylsulfatase A
MKALIPALAFLGAAVAASPAAIPPASRPNIILILADDLGIADVGCYGSDHFRTPQLDRLAAGGVRFECCYSTPLCGPSRCEILTGRYPFRTGLINNHSAEAIHPGREVMIPTVLKRAGYVTASVGKWGQLCLGPGEWGFDEYLTFRGSGRYWREQAPQYTIDGQRKDLPAGRYLPDLMHEFVVDFITRHQDQPFFVYYPMSHIHGPIVRTPDSPPGASRQVLYADNIAYMDKLVGRLVEALDRLGLRGRTLIVFSGDNGTARFGVDRATIGGRHLRGMKGTLLEGGSRVPLIVNWPGTAPAGVVCRDLIDFSDFFATLAELGRAELPAGVTLDSRSFAPQVRGVTGRPRDWIYVELNGGCYVRNGRYKLTDQGRFYDLSQAPFLETPLMGKSLPREATVARSDLQTVLDQHPAAAGTGAGGGKRVAKKERNTRRPQP